MLAARKRSSFSLVLSLTLLVLAAAAPALAHDPSASPGHTVSQEARARRETLTTDLVRLNVQYRLAASGQKPRLEQDLMAASLNRKQEMLGLIDSDPGSSSDSPFRPPSGRACP